MKTYEQGTTENKTLLMHCPSCNKIENLKFIGKKW